MMTSQGGGPTRTRSLKDRLRDGINFTWHGKSKSVDHSVLQPMDHESLTRKVSENMLSPTTEQPPEDAEPKGDKPRKVSPPPHTLSYSVVGSDTLSAIAARFGTTPSELTKLNKLTSRFVFPGQTLYVPEKSTRSASSRSSSQTESASERGHLISDFMDMIRPPSPRPGHLERVRTPSTPYTSADHSADDDPYLDKDCLQKFLKINVRHITDGQGVVCGVLLVTPNAIMFDPNVSDPLVIEHGPEAYGVIAPMDLVVNAALYHDIAHMRVKDADDIPRQDIPKPPVYRSSLSVNTAMVNTKQHSTETEASPKDVTLPLSQRSSSSSNCSQREGGAFPKAFDEGLVTPENSPVGEDDKKDSSHKSADTQPDNKGQNKSRHESGFFDWESVPEESLADSPAIVSPPPTTTSSAAVSTATSSSSTTTTTASTATSSSADAGTTKSSTVTTTTATSASSVAATTTSSTSSTAPSSPAPAHPLSSSSSPAPGSSSPAPVHHPSSSPGPVRHPPPVHHPASTRPQADSSSHPSSPAPTLQDPLSSANAKHEQGATDHSHPLHSSAESLQEVSNRGGNAQTVAQQASCDSRPAVRLRQGDGSFTPPPQIESKKQKVLKRLSQPLTWMESLSGEVLRDSQSAPPSGDALQHSVFAKVFSSSPKNLVDFSSGLFTKSPDEFGRIDESTGTSLDATDPDNKRGASLDITRHHSLKRQNPPHHHHPQQQPTPPMKDPAKQLGWKSMVSVDDMPGLFASFDKLIPRPAASNDDPPLYLRLRMGKPVNKSIPKSTPMMSYGKKRIRPEYWFSIPKTRVDDLYEFFMLWACDVYGDLDEAAVQERGYMLIDKDTDLFEDNERGDDEGGAADAIQVNIKESWEDEARRVPAYSWSMSSIDTEYMPDLVGTTDILQDEHRKELAKNLPPRAEGYSWQLLFSTSQHGFSLASLYRKMEDVDTPVLLVIQDTRNIVFGAMLSGPPRLSDHFYGTGESFLFSFYPEFHVYNWSGENMYFIRGELDTLAIGSGEGHAGLLVDGDLYQGRTQQCATYRNDLLTASEDFIIKALECYGFV